MKNKFLRILLAIITIATSVIGITNVKAQTYEGRIKAGNYISGPYRVVHKKGTFKSYHNAQMIVRTNDGAFVYCVQPLVTVNEDSTYQVTTEDINSLLNVSQATWSEVSKIAYYGYQYSDATHNHSDDKWWAATQMLIWQKIDPTVDSYFSQTVGGEKDNSILRYEMNEIMDLVNNHTKKPELNNIPSEMIIGQSITLTDTSGVLSSYELENIKGLEVTKNGNTLTIKATEVGISSFNLTKMGNRYGNAIELYYATDSQNVMHRGNIDPIRIANNIKVYGGKVTIEKTDDETKSQVAQGEGTLEEAIYGVYKEDGTKVGTITTDSNGNATSDYLPSLGKFYVLEEKASLGYEIDKNKYYFEVTQDDLNPKIQVFEKVIKTKYDYVKVYANDKTGIMNPEKNVQFDIYNNKDEFVQSVITNDEGNMVFSLPYGTYTVKQVTSTKGFEKMKDFTLKVTETKTEKKVISNAEITAKLRVVKIDSETKEVIKRSGIKFKILDTKTNEYVCQTISYPKKTVCEFETDENGEFITAYPLNTGTYKLVEVDQRIDGYLWNKESKEFTIDENSNLREDSEYGIIFDTYFENTPVKGKVVINKVGEVANLEEGKGYTYTNESLSGIEFGLYQNDTLISKGTTDENGKLVFDNLKLGKYCIKELKTKDGYILNDKSVCFEIKYKDQYTPVITYETLIENKLKTTKYELTKKDISTEETLPNTTIRIYTIDDKLVYEGKTNEEGRITIDRLPIGKYYFEEVEAPEGYLINEEKMYFEIQGEEIVKSVMKDEKITGTLEFTKTDYSESITLPNTTIEIYNDKDELIYTGTTDENGKIVIEKLEYGKYYILEKNAPEGYTLSTEKMYFEIKENGEIVKCTLKDEKIIEVPNTEENKNYYLEIGSIVLMSLGLGVLIYEKRKNKKNK